MVTENLGNFFRHLARGMAGQVLRELSDQQLVEMALSEDREVAFQTIACRHGSMVYRVCWRGLQHAQDAEDAFQATFLVLGQRLRTLRKQTSLASWLHGVAHRLALKLKAQSATWRSHLQRASRSEMLPSDDAPWREVRSVLDFELSQLPDKWRLPLIFCYLEGRTQDESARLLGWSKRTFKRRLREARTALRCRLNSRGFTLPSAQSAILLTDCISAASPPPRLVAATVEAAFKVASGQSLSACGVSEGVAAFAKGAFTMSAKNVMFVLVLVLLTATITVASGTLAEPDQVPPPKPYRVTIVEDQTAVEPILPVDPKIRVEYHYNGCMSFQVTAEGKRLTGGNNFLALSPFHGHGSGVSASFIIDGVHERPMWDMNWGVAGMGMNPMMGGWNPMMGGMNPMWGMNPMGSMNPMGGMNPKMKGMKPKAKGINPMMEMGWNPMMMGMALQNLPDGPSGKKRHSGQTIWQKGDIRVTMVLEVVPGKPSLTNPGVPGQRRMDTLLVKYVIENLGTVSHKVGCRTFVDTLVGNNDGALFAAPKTHPKQILNGKVLEGQHLPDVLEVLELPDLQDPGFKGIFTCKFGHKLEGPGKIVLTTAAQNMTNFEVGVEQAGNSACALFWQPQELNPESKREVAFAYGQGIACAYDGHVTAQFGGSFAPGKVFTITAYVDDPMNGQLLSLELPKEIERLDGKAAQVVPLGEGHGKQVVQWRCRLLQVGTHTIQIRSNTGATYSWKMTISPE